MKIRPDQIEALQQHQQQANKTKKVNGTAFGEVLNQEAQQVEGQQTSNLPPVPGLQSINPLLQMQQVASVQAATLNEGEFVGKIENLFGELENYAKHLGSPDSGGLKNAYKTLEGVQGGVESLKKDWPGVASENPELSSIVNELEVMAMTEQIKFNRGDYV
ncbi:hypothetical protein [Maridesulfovibrio ferrireducens]|uniref:hypothetical protein n=1 Tax=Maridesulfovibrio ferrireducens TaxID=246191 RepID=UPI001A2E0891|nr:hypothetical protein [Maridesulfovibrio ferrireducens]MBI9112032.1 hypothetical protein [Maridesulfovibrio ferrireducens]